MYHRIVTESQNGWGWKGTLGVILSHLPVQAVPPTRGSPALCPDGFCISNRMETPQPLWATSARARSPS